MEEINFDKRNDPAPYLFNNQKLKKEEYEKILRDAEKGLINLVPNVFIKPCPGSLYIVKTSSNTRRFKINDLYRFHQNDKPKKKDKDKDLKQYVYFHLIENGNRLAKRDKNFQKLIFFLESSRQNITLVHYYGDNSKYKDMPHKNSLNLTKIFHTPSDELKIKLSNQVEQHKSNIKVQANTVFGLKEHEQLVPEIFSANNVDQVAYERKKKLNENRIFIDAFQRLIDLWLQGMRFIQRIEIVPLSLIVLADDNVIDLANRLLEYGEQTISVDTTFKLADGFYVTPLVMRNIEIQKDPLFPVCFLVHQQKYEEVHSEFWTHFVSKRFKLNSNLKVKIVCDRERAIINSILESIKNTDCKLIYCENHIIMDAQYFLLKLKNKLKQELNTEEQQLNENLKLIDENFFDKDAVDSEINLISIENKIDDVKISKYKRDLKSLLNSNSIVKYREMLNNCKLNWSKEFLNFYFKYLDNNVRDNIINKKFFEVNFLSENYLSESFNHQFKCFLEKIESPVDEFVFDANKFTYCFMFEFALCYFNNSGKFSLKEEFKDKKLKLKVEKCSITEELLKESKKVYSEIIPQPDCTQTKLAALVLQNDCIEVNSKFQTFNVKHPFNDAEIHLVYFIKQKPKCTCKSTKECFHIKSVKMWLSNQSYKEKDGKSSVNTFKSIYEQTKWYKKPGRKGKAEKLRKEMKPTDLKFEDIYSDFQIGSENNKKNLPNIENDFQIGSENSKKNLPNIEDDLDYDLNITDDKTIKKAKISVPSYDSNEKNLNNKRKPNELESDKTIKKTKRVRKAFVLRSGSYKKNKYDEFDKLVNSLEDGNVLDDCCLNNKVANGLHDQNEVDGCLDDQHSVQSLPVTIESIDENYYNDDIDLDSAKSIAGKEIIGDEELAKLKRISLQLEKNSIDNWYTSTLINNYYYYLDMVHNLNNFFYVEPQIFGNLFLINIKLLRSEIFNTDYLICPVNIKNAHWITAFIFLNTCKIFILDTAVQNENFYINIFKQLNSILLLFKIRNEKEINLENLKISNFLCKDCPQQTNSFDCGSRTCYFIYLFTSLDLDRPFDQNFKEQISDSFEYVKEIKNLSFYSKKEMKDKIDKNSKFYLKKEFIDYLDKIIINIQPISYHDVYSFN